MILLKPFCVPSVSEKISYYVNSSKFVHCLKIHAYETRFKQINENIRLKGYAHMFLESMYKISNHYLHKQLKKMGPRTSVSKFCCESVFTCKHNPSLNLLSSFLPLIWVYQYLFIL